MSSSPETYPKLLRQGRPTKAGVTHIFPLAKKILTAATNAGCAHVVAVAMLLCVAPWWGAKKGEGGILL